MRIRGDPWAQASVGETLPRFPVPVKMKKFAHWTQWLGGDIVTGSATVILAMGAGRRGEIH